MATTAARARKESGRARSELRARLEERREEIEAATLTRVRAISDPSEVTDPAYADGLRAAVAAAVAYGIETTGREVADPPIPVALLAQARMAVRVGIPLDTVLRRYFAGYSLLGYFILEEAASVGLTDGAELQRLLGAHAGIFDRLLAAVGEEHGREAEIMRSSTERRQAERIERLLAGEMVDTSAIPYDFEGWHLGVVADGPEAEQRIRTLAASLDCGLLALPRENSALPAWLSATHRLDPLQLKNALASHDGDSGATVALGESAERVAGWQLTHRQAVAAFLVAQRTSDSVVLYADVMLLATAMKDDVIVASLRQRYLGPLQKERDGGVALRRTLRAYLASGGSLSSAAAAIGVSPRTVGNRLHRAEELVGQPLHAFKSDLDVALRLAALDALP